MFHLFEWKLKHHGDDCYLQNEFFGVLVEYIWDQKKWTWYLHPLIDPTRNTIKYYAFDTHSQKVRFEWMCKIQWVWGKTGYQLAMKDDKDLTQALHDFDIKYFTSISGIWPKTAKRILVELKTSMTWDDLKKLDIDDKLLKDILKSLHDLWYERKKVKELLSQCPLPLVKGNLPEIMKWLVDNL